jgi:DNA mismatch repair protein MutS
MPKPLIKRAKDILRDLESQSGDFALKTPTKPAKPPPPGQSPLFEIAPHPAVAALRALKVEELSPLEALTTLYELQRLARGD